MHGLSQAYTVVSDLFTLFSDFVGDTFIYLTAGFVSIGVLLKLFHKEV